MKLKQKIDRFRTQVKQGRQGGGGAAPASEASRRHAPPATAMMSAAAAMPLSTPGAQFFPDTPSAF